MRPRAPANNKLNKAWRRVVRARDPRSKLYNLVALQTELALNTRTTPFEQHYHEHGRALMWCSMCSWAEDNRKLLYFISHKGNFPHPVSSIKRAQTDIRRRRKKCASGWEWRGSGSGKSHTQGQTGERRKSIKIIKYRDKNLPFYC